jgi:hypothetical protein
MAMKSSKWLLSKILSIFLVADIFFPYLRTKVFIFLILTRRERRLSLTCPAPLLAAS